MKVSRAKMPVVMFANLSYEKVCYIIHYLQTTSTTIYMPKTDSLTLIWDIVTHDVTMTIWGFMIPPWLFSKCPPQKIVARQIEVFP